MEMDALIFGAMAAAGLNDPGWYVPPGQPASAAVRCDVMIDRDVEIYGDERTEVAARVVTATFQRGQVDPKRGGTIVLGLDPLSPSAERFAVKDQLSLDESQSVWMVTDAR